MPPRKGSAREQHNFKRARDALPPALPRQSLGSTLVQGGQPTQQFLPGEAGEIRVKCTASIDRKRWLLEHRVGQCTQKKTRATHQDWDAAARADFGDPDTRIVCESSRTVALGRIDQIQTVVRHEGAFGIGWFGGTDVETAINLAGVK